jgi:hypothetical protein
MIVLADRDAERRAAFRQASVQRGDAGGGLLERVQARVFRVRRRAVIAFEIVLDRQLPVRRDLVVRAMGDARIGPAIGAETVAQRLLDTTERERRRGERDEDQPLDDTEMNRLEPIGGGVEIRRHVTRRTQRAVEPVGPGVVGTDQEFGMAGLRAADARAAVTADIGEAAQHAILAAHDDHRFVGQLEEEIIARLRRLAGMAGAEPMAPQQAIDIAPENVGMAIKGLGQRAALGLPRQQALDLRPETVPPILYRNCHRRLTPARWRCQTTSCLAGREIERRHGMDVGHGEEIVDRSEVAASQTNGMLAASVPVYYHEGVPCFRRRTV